MPFADGVFDTIVSTFPAEFIFDPATWQEVARLMCNAESASQTVRGRFVVIGLLAIRTGRLRCPGVSSSSQNTRDEVLARIYQLAQAAGLDCRIEIRSFPGHDLPILIAEKSK